MMIRSTILNTIKALKIIKYDGTNHLCLHLSILSSDISLITMDNDIHAKLFSISGDVIDWFGKLTHASIENFEQLKLVFSNFYQIQISNKVTFSDLMKIKQREGQSIESFIKYWIRIENQVYIDDDINIISFIKAL